MKRANLLLAFLAFAAVCYGQTGGGDPTPREGTRDRILFEAGKLVGLRESTGHNDGPLVEAILATTGNSKGDPWCASANRYIYDKAGFRLVGPRSAWSPAWVARPTWTRAMGGLTPLPGDAFGIWFPSKGRIAHTGLVERWGKVVLTLEGNTNADAVAGSAADRDGGGYHRKRRLQSQVHSVRNWILGN